MKVKLNIQQKIQLFFISASIIVYTVAIGIISVNSKKMAYNDSIEIANFQVNEAAKDIKTQMDANIAILVSLSDAFKVYNNFPKDEWMDLVHEMYYNVFEGNDNVYALWSSWELQMIDPEWELPYGRVSHTFWRENGMIKDLTELKSLTGNHALYEKAKTITNPTIDEPYFDVITEDKRESLLMTTIKAPVFKNGQFVAINAFDITLLQFQELVEKIKPFEGSYAFMISNGGMITGHYDYEFLNQNIKDVFPEDDELFNITQNIKKGENFNYITKNEFGDQIYVTFAPIQIGETNTPWSIAISIPIETIMSKANRSFRISLIVGVVGIFVLFVIVALISRNITNPLSKITSLLNRIAKGHIDEDMFVEINTGDEIDEMADALNTSLTGFLAKQKFAEDIGNGKLNTSVELLSEEDTLGRSLAYMRDSLIQSVKEEEKRKKEDEKRKWTNEGIALFGDILRQNNDNIEELGSQIIQNIVNYLNANQGGLFILNDENDEDVYLEILSAFAYDRRKFIQKRIEVGEGLIGTCAIEKQSIYMTDLPQDYVEITSGLGGANPKALLIVPLKLEDSILGVIEIASFSEFETHEIEFVEKVGESIAATLSSVRINIRTSQLLEHSQQQGEEMAAQEEEMRQNMEELKATQEESSRKSAEMTGLIEALDKSSFVIEYNLEGNITDINEMYLNILEISKEEVIGTHHSANVDFTPDQKLDYDNFWNDLRNGKVKKETSEITINGKQFIFAETYSPMRDANGEVTKILKISNNISEERNKERALMKKIKKHEKVLNKIMDEFPGKVFLKNSECELIMVNKAVLEAHGETEEELLGKSDYDFYEDQELAEKYIQAEKEIMKGDRKEYLGEEDFSGKKVILHTVKIPFYIDYLDETGILGIQVDVTDSTRNKEKLEEALKEIEKLKKKR